jgi:hypothetical protein
MSNGTLGKQTVDITLTDSEGASSSYTLNVEFYEVILTSILNIKEEVKVKETVVEEVEEEVIVDDPFANVIV